MFCTVQGGSNFESVDEILECDHTILLKATEQNFPIILFIMMNN